MSIALRALALAATALAGCAWATPWTLSLTDAQGRPLPDGVALLYPLRGNAPSPAPLAGMEIGQAERQFQPLVTVVPVGTAVAFPNRDTVRHHVYSFSEPKRFEIKLYVGRPEKPVVFDRPGVVVLGCNIHDHMVGWVVVADTPWYARTGPQGQAHWADLPAGAYRVRLWHPSLPPGSSWPEHPLTLGNEPLASTLRLNLRP